MNISYEKNEYSVRKKWKCRTKKMETSYAVFGTVSKKQREKCFVDTYSIKNMS